MGRAEDDAYLDQLAAEEDVIAELNIEAALRKRPTKETD